MGIAVVTPQGRTLLRNLTLVTMYGYDSQEEFVKVPTEQLYYDPKDRERFVELMSEGAAKDFEARRVRKDGSVFWTTLNSIRQTSADGEEQFITVIQDIDQRKRAEEALRASEERFHTLFENAPVGISITTPDGRAIERNRGSRRCTAILQERSS